MNLVRRTTVAELDPALPTVSLGAWFKELVGPRAGVNWQLSECGDAPAPSNGDLDLPACMEANAILPDGHMVVLAILVGTFKKGLASKAAFNFGVVEYEEQLRPAKKLSDLPRLLSATPQFTEKNLVVPPEIEANVKPITWLPQTYFPLLLSDKHLLKATLDADSSHPEDIPPPPDQTPYSSSSHPQAIQQVTETVLEGSAITRVDAVYPPTARMMKAFDFVKKQ